MTLAAHARLVVRTLCSLAARFSGDGRNMTTQRTANEVGTTRDGDVRPDPVVDYWQTLARTADLVRKLTSLADRYDEAGDDDGRAAQRRASVALMRAAAESGRRLVNALVPPPATPASAHEASPEERADAARARDVRASARDAAAEIRDQRAAGRDRVVRRVGGDSDIDFSGQWLAACDRDEAVGDRAAAQGDRRAAADDRAVAASRVVVDLDKYANSYALITRLEEREIVRQAQGVLMARAGISAGEAFEALLLAAATLRPEAHPVTDTGTEP